MTRKQHNKFAAIIKAAKTKVHSHRISAFGVIELIQDDIATLFDEQDTGFDWGAFSNKCRK